MVLVTLSLSALKKALCLELLINGVHRIAADAKILRHLAAGRKLAPGWVALVEYPFGQPLIQLMLQRMRAVQANIINHINWSYQKSQSGSLNGIRSAFQ